MEYLVKISPRAERDLFHLFQEINAESSKAAHDWYQGLKQAILSLQTHPNRCPVTRKKGELRHLLYGSRPHVYRVIFRILEKQKHIEVLHIRHGARRKFKESDLA
jgi:plasmid stabilization system protein ParE